MFFVCRPLQAARNEWFWNEHDKNIRKLKPEGSSFGAVLDQRTAPVFQTFRFLNMTFGQEIIISCFRPIKFPETGHRSIFPSHLSNERWPVIGRLFSLRFNPLIQARSSNQTSYKPLPEWLWWRVTWEELSSLFPWWRLPFQRKVRTARWNL